MVGWGKRREEDWFLSFYGLILGGDESAARQRVGLASQAEARATRCNAASDRGGPPVPVLSSPVIRLVAA